MLTMSYLPHRGVDGAGRVVFLPVVTGNVTVVSCSQNQGNCRVVVNVFFFFFFFFCAYIITCNAALLLLAVLAHTCRVGGLLNRARFAIKLVVEQQPPAVDLLHAAAVVRLCAAVRVGSEQDADGPLALVRRHPGDVGEPADAGPHDALGVGLAEHRDPHQPGGVVLEPDRGAGDRAVDLDETVRHRRHPIRHYNAAQTLQ
jgi:hypothetical protein